MAEMEDSDYIVSDEEVEQLKSSNHIQGEDSRLKWKIHQISTNKERHSRLGEDNLDDTLEYDFAGECLRNNKIIENMNAKKCDLLNDQNIGQEAEAEKFPGSKELIVSDPLTPIPKTQACVLYCGSLSPCTLHLKAENNANIKEGITDLERDKN